MSQSVFELKSRQGKVPQRTHNNLIGQQPRRGALCICFWLLQIRSLWFLTSQCRSDVYFLPIQTHCYETVRNAD
jgi:hypothetical protein